MDQTGNPVLRIVYAIVLNSYIRKYNTRLYTELYLTREKRRSIEDNYSRVDKENDRILKGNPDLQSLIESFLTGEMNFDGIIVAAQHIDFHPLNGEIQIYPICQRKILAA
jgi:hypothetical protein